uniref:Aldose 1-epimerase n=1 Tax=Eptatretus burgeri TaxID=7764 RepID=A0A8C4QHM8_EPTBU
MTDAPEEGAPEEGPASCAFHSAGVSARVLSGGAALHELLVRDSRGASADVLLGFDSADDYLENPAYIGVVVGRVANRIGGSKFSLGGREFRVSQNDGTHCLHGGSAGFSKAIWKSKPIPGGVTLTINSPDGDQGFPGAVEASVTYLLRGQELEISYRATTTHSTPLSLTSHVYFNLAGQGNIYDHEVSIAADNYIPVDDTSIPTGEIASVEGTLFDLRKPVRLRDRLANLPGGGFDHNFCLMQGQGRHPCARVYDRGSGRTLTVETTMPGVQLYTANALSGVLGKGGTSYSAHDGLCLETQHWPDAVNKPHFPSPILHPGEMYNHTTWYTFTTE